MSTPTPPQGVVTVMFTDIVGSTSARDRLVAEFGEVDGDALFRSRVLEQHNAAVRELLRIHNGYEVKTNGDSFMASFANATDAIRCAAGIQRFFHERPISTAAGAALSVRIGLHTSQPTLYRTPQGWDYDGHAVNIAARIESLLRGGGQILCSGVTRELSRGLPDITFHGCGKYPLKGVGQPVEIHEVLWRNDQTPDPPARAPELPYPWLTPWIDRERPRLELQRALLSERLITLHGEGGVGKTRLAVETLLHLKGSLPTEIIFVSLADRQNTGDDFLAAVREALGATSADVPDFPSLTKSLHNQSTLLILDNFETVTEATPYVLQLAALPQTRLLLTSQRLLGAVEEYVVRLQPMATGGDLPQLESYQLFVTLARRHHPGWEPDDTHSLHRVLELSAGIPYIIEILAASVAHKTLRDIADELGSAIGNVASGTSAGARPDRHRSVRACLQWALDHLQAVQRQTLIRLSIFPGSFDVAGAMAVCGAVRETYDALVDAALLRFDAHDGRYSMLGVTRESARELLGDEIATLRGIHAGWYIDQLEQADHDLWECGGSRRIGARQWIAAERANLDAALKWAECHDMDMFRRGVAASTAYLDLHFHGDEMLRLNFRLGELLPLDAPPVYRARQLNDLGRAYWRLTTGDRVANIQQAIDCYNRALQLYGNSSPRLSAATHNNLGLAYWSRTVGDRGENLRYAISCYETALTTFTEAEAPVRWAWTQHNMGLAYMYMPTGDIGDNLSRAIACYEAALRVYTERDFPDAWARAQNNLGGVYWNLPSGSRDENLKRAITCVTASLRVFTETDFPADWAMGQFNIAAAYTQLTNGERDENIERAIRHCHDSMRVYTREKFPIDWATANGLLGLAYMNRTAGDRRANLEQAISCFNTELEVINERDFSCEWGVAQDNLGATLVLLGEYAGDGPRIRAIAALEAALRVRSRDEWPREWAITQDNLGCAYRDLQDGQPRNLRRAISCFDFALSVFTEGEFTAEWARTQRNLALTYERLAANGSQRSRNRAVTHYENAARGLSIAGYDDQAEAARAKAASLRAVLSAARPNKKVPLRRGPGQ